MRVAVVLVLIALGSHARADGPVTKPDWYGHRMLWVDVPATATMVGAFVLLARSSADAPTFGVIAQGSLFAVADIAYIANGPVVHRRARQHGRAWASFALRLLGPPLVVLAGRQIYRENANNGADELLWLSLGLTATSAIDIGVLARR